MIKQSRNVFLTLAVVGLFLGSCKSVRKTKMRSGSGDGDSLSSRMLDTSEDKKSYFDQRNTSFGKKGKFRTRDAKLGGRDLASEFISGKGEFGKKEFSGSKDSPRFAGQRFYGSGLEASLPERLEKTSSEYSNQQMRGTVGEARGWARAGDTFGTQAVKDAAESQADPIPVQVKQRASESDLGVGLLKGILNKGD